MISVEEATARIAAAFAPVAAERIALGQGAGRVLTEDIRARMNQPPDPMSSMDGYAVRADDAAVPGATLTVVGTAPAGHPYGTTLKPGEAVRIFTGGVVPEGADSIVIQEDAKAEGGKVTFTVAAIHNRHIRAAGLDFKTGDLLVRAGKRLTARDLALIAAGDVPEISVRRRPRVAIAATGDELSPPGSPHKPGGIVASSGFALAAMIARAGGEPVDLGILPDTVEAVASIADRAAEVDLVITIGGASVGEHDLVQKALGPRGFALDFWKIAMRPGKPLIFGKLGKTPLIGLPGNPVSTLVCAQLYLKPALAALLGTAYEAPMVRARLARDLKANDQRQDFIRTRIETRDGEPWAEPFALQDSSMMSVLAAADGLIVRPPHAPAAKAGDPVPVLLLD